MTELIVNPNLQENLSNVIMESLARGTPPQPFGIGWILNFENYNGLCQNARNKILREFDSILVIEKYIALYKEVLNG